MNLFCLFVNSFLFFQEYLIAFFFFFYQKKKKNHLPLAFPFFPLNPQPVGSVMQCPCPQDRPGCSPGPPHSCLLGFPHCLTGFVLLLPGSHIFPLGPFGSFREGRSFRLLGRVHACGGGLSCVSRALCDLPVRPLPWCLSREPLGRCARRRGPRGLRAQPRPRLPDQHLQF